MICTVSHYSKQGPGNDYLVTMTTSAMVLSNTMVYCWSLGTTNVSCIRLPMPSLSAVVSSVRGVAFPVWVQILASKLGSARLSDTCVLALCQTPKPTPWLFKARHFIFEH